MYIFRLAFSSFRISRERWRFVCTLTSCRKAEEVKVGEEEEVEEEEAMSYARERERECVCARICCYTPHSSYSCFIHASIPDGQNFTPRERERERVEMPKHH
jgi:hypothetical protein